MATTSSLLVEQQLEILNRNVLPTNGNSLKRLFYELKTDTRRRAAPIDLLNTGTLAVLGGYVPENCREWQNHERRDVNSMRIVGLRSQFLKMTNNK